MKSSLESIVSLFPLMLAVALAAPSLGEVMGKDGRQVAVACMPSELSPCMPAMTSPEAPSGMCCQKLREQQPCFCGYLRNPALVAYVSSPRAREICKSCGVPIPSSAAKSRSTVISLGRGLGLGGASVVAVLLGICGFLFLRRKRRKVRLRSTSRESSNALMSKLLISACKYSRTFASFPSSKSDLEKGSSTYFGVQVFDYGELEVATRNFNPAKELGDGGFGTVYQGELQDGRAAAVKRLYEHNVKRVQQFMKEIEILQRLHHPILVKLYGCTSRRSQELLLVYEFIPNGTVADHICRSRTNSEFPWAICLNITIEPAGSLAYLHASDIIHRDVKTNNILLDNDFCVKVANFGLSWLFPTDVNHVSTAPQGTPGYVDPEYYQCYQLTDKSDVYSFRVVLCELISSKPAVDTSRHRHDVNLASMAMNRIQNQLFHQLVDPCLGFDTDYPVRRGVRSVAELAFHCLQEERNMRPGMGEVFKILREIKSERVDERKAEVMDDVLNSLKGLTATMAMRGGRRSWI